jgi:hypothetical protein
LRGHNFLNSIPFFMIFSALDVLRRVQVLFRHHKQWSPPLGFGLFWVFNYYSCNSISTNEQLKDLTHMFCLRIPCYKLYKEALISYVFTLKYMCHFGMSWKKLNVKEKPKIRNKISCLFFNAFSFVLSYLFTYLGKYVGM